METNVDVMGAFIGFAPCWSIVDWAKRAELDVAIGLCSFRLAQISAFRDD